MNQERSELRAESMFSDPAFTENRELPIHRWVPWIAGFSARFVSDVIQRENVTPTPENLVCDPFAGVGTTLVEAKMRGYDSCGIEINPYALLVCQAKLRWDIDLEALDGQIARLKSYVRTVDISPKNERLDSYAEMLSHRSVPQPKLKAPEGFRTREPFFDPETNRRVLLLKEFLQETPSELRDLFRIGLGSILVKFSRYAYGPSLGRKSVMRIKTHQGRDVGAALVKKILEMRADLRWARESVLPRLPREPDHRLYGKSVFRCLKGIEDESIRILVTSPPYLNNYHYPRNTRPHLYWLDFVKEPKDLEKLENESFGKFWQTVRDLPEVRLDIPLPELEGRIKRIRSKDPAKGIYGGKGWANYIATYFNDVNRFFSAIKPKIRRAGLMVWVLGNSVIQGTEVKTERYLAQIAERNGFLTEGIHIVRKKRVGSSIVNSGVRSTPARTTGLYEAAVILRNR